MNTRAIELSKEHGIPLVSMQEMIRLSIKDVDSLGILDVSKRDTLLDWSVRQRIELYLNSLEYVRKVKASRERHRKQSALFVSVEYV